MPKITELSPILGNRTKSVDLFVTVSLEEGEQGTKNITRAELAKALEQEDFNAIRIAGGSIANVSITNPNIRVDNFYSEPLNANDYFIIRNTANQTVKIAFSSLQNEISAGFQKTTKVYVDSSASQVGTGSYGRPFQTLDEAFAYTQDAENPISISVFPGLHKTNGNLALPDYCSIVSMSGQYSTTIEMNEGYEEENCILVGSGCYVQGFSFNNLRVDDLDNPSSGFAVAFRPNALILRSPYIRDISQISNYRRETIAAPLDPVNGNPLVGRGGGVLLADRAVLNQNSIFPYMLAFGATPRSPNGIGYVAKNGAGINGISSISIFQRTAFYALSGGQITLNNSGTQFGDISMRAKGFTTVVDPHETSVSNLIVSTDLADWIEANFDEIINDMWFFLVTEGYEVNETFTRRDARNWLQSMANDFRSGQQTGTRNFVAGLFDYKADLVFDPNGYAGVGKVLIDAFIDSYDRIRDYIVSVYSPTEEEETMLDELIVTITIDTVTNPRKLNFGSLIESLGHQFNLAGAGVNKNALPLNFRRVGKPLAASGSVLQEDGGRVRWSGADELNNTYFTKGLRVNGRTGRLEGRPFTSSVRRLARRAANSRTF
jgi:hypothetical protein